MVKRVSVTLLGALLLTAAPACSRDASCQSVAMSIAAAAVGERTPAAAVAAFVGSRAAPAGMPRSGWKAAGPGRFTSRGAIVTVARLANNTYVVTEAGC